MKTFRLIFFYSACIAGFVFCMDRADEVWTVHWRPLIDQLGTGMNLWDLAASIMIAPVLIPIIFWMKGKP